MGWRDEDERDFVGRYFDAWSGVVELIIAAVGIELIISNDVYSLILVVVAFITTLLPPVAMGDLLKLYGYKDLQKLDDTEPTLLRKPA